MVHLADEVRQITEKAIASGAAQAALDAAHSRLRRPQYEAPPSEDPAESFASILVNAVEISAQLRAPSLLDRYRSIAMTLWKSCQVVCTLHHAVPSQRSWCTLGDPYLVVHTVSANGVESPVVADGANWPIRRHITVIDLCFRERFQLARSSADYREFLAELPEVFIGDFGQLVETVERVGHEMRESYRELRDDVPPWRTARALRLSYWYKDPSYVQEISLPDPRALSSGSD
eukprot:TRINITY_DN21019_c0_g1_i1.p2 TRINITY_DN21019_c0_g1~~TRINITY_DN21019_c0_g1_i1.p2  ORF type:complete len:232 (+),score=75.02 TRINITY_DN21019_c0_g1_i1:92-787(+)